MHGRFILHTPHTRKDWMEKEKWFRKIGQADKWILLKRG